MRKLTTNMLSVETAQQLVFQHARRRPAEIAALTPALLGQVLADDVASDIDMPPYDKALMDGYAIRSGDITGDGTILKVVEEVLAGYVPQEIVSAGQASQIMTGGVLPAGADAVVPIEKTEAIDKLQIRIQLPAVKPEQNVLRKGREMRRGETALPAGSRLRPQELGLLATVGKTAISVFRRPDVAMLSTGDEVIEPAATPGPGQIRNSNASMLVGQITRAGGVPLYVGIARDTLASLRPLVARGLKADIFILSGGVSAGKVDLVPEVLQEHGVEPIFHKIAMKPGKPLFFGVKGDTLVFGLPGNPVSSLVGFELFVRPAIRQMTGVTPPGPLMLTARLGADYQYATDRPTYHPAKLVQSGSSWQVTPVPWFGSPDLRGVTQANAFVLFGSDRKEYHQGEELPVLAPEME